MIGKLICWITRKHKFTRHPSAPTKTCRRCGIVREVKRRKKEVTQ